MHCVSCDFQLVAFLISGHGPVVELFHDMFVKLHFFQGYEFELQLLCIEMTSEIVLQHVQHFSTRLHSM